MASDDAAILLESLHKDHQVGLERLQVAQPGVEPVPERTDESIQRFSAFWCVAYHCLWFLDYYLTTGDEPFDSPESIKTDTDPNWSHDATVGRTAPGSAKCTLDGATEDDASLAPWRDRWLELQSEPDAVDHLLAEVEAVADRMMIIGGGRIGGGRVLRGPDPGDHTILHQQRGVLGDAGAVGRGVRRDAGHQQVVAAAAAETRCSTA
mgnify:CR=1 FL=1